MWKLKNGSTIQFGEKMLNGADNGKCAISKQCERVDIKQELEINITYIKEEISNAQERLRVKGEQLKLIKSDKKLEAFLNLNRSNY